LEEFSKWLVSDYPRTLQLLKELGPVSVAVIAAAIASLIQWRQWRTADLQRRISEDKLRIELFDRRFDIYLQLSKYINHISTHGNMDYEAHDQLIAGLTSAKFLFGKDMNEYFEKLRIEGIKLKSISEVFQHLSPGEQRSKLVNERSEIFRMFMEQYEEAPRRFEPYIGFGKLKS
jgi:hypothetical protein